MIAFDCPHCQKRLSLDETKLPMKEVSFPCPTCKATLHVDRRLFEASAADEASNKSASFWQTPSESKPDDRRHQTSPRSENRKSTTAPPQAAAGKQPAPDRASIVATQCTSCKATLEIEQDSLSPREPTALKCPSCGTMLTVDKRKLQAALGGGPVVRVATATYEPLPPLPSQDDLKGTDETGEYVRILHDFYAGAEDYLDQVVEIGKREAVLREAQRRGTAALETLGVSAPAPTNRYLPEATGQPEMRTIDGAVLTESLYLHNVRGITETAVRLHPLLRSPQRYGPAVDWQKATYAALAAAYESAAAHSPQVGTNLDHLRQAEKAYGDMCARYQTDKRTLDGAISENTSHLADLTNKINGQSREIDDLEASATKAAKDAIMEKGGGCASAVIAAVLGTIIGAGAGSAMFGFVLFVLFVAGGLYVTYQYGYGKNSDKRNTASGRLGQLRDEYAQTEGRAAQLRGQLAVHIDNAPDTIVKTVPIAQAWSPMTTDDFDEKRPSLVVPAASAPPRPRPPAADVASP